MFNYPATAFLASAAGYPGAAHLAPGYGVASAPYFASRYSPYGSPAPGRSPYAHQAASAYQQMLAHPLHMPGMPLPPTMAPNYGMPEAAPLASSPSYLPDLMSGAGSSPSYDSVAASRVSPDPSCLQSPSGKVTPVQGDDLHPERGSPSSLNYAVPQSYSPSYNPSPVSGFSSGLPLMPSHIPFPSPPSSATSSPCAPKDQSSRSDSSASYDGDSSYESRGAASPPSYSASSVNGLPMMPSYVPTTVMHRADSSPAHSSLVFDGKCGYESCDKDSDFEPRTSSSPIEPGQDSGSPSPLTPTYMPIPAPPSRASSTSAAQPSSAFVRVYRGCEVGDISCELSSKNVNVDGVKAAVSPIVTPEKPVFSSSDSSCSESLDSSVNVKEPVRTEAKKLFQPYKNEA